MALFKYFKSTKIHLFPKYFTEQKLPSVMVCEAIEAANEEVTAVWKADKRQNI